MIRAEIEDDLQMDAIRIEGIEKLDAHKFFENLLPRPWISKHNELYVIAVNKPVVLEVERGLLGSTHLETLYSFLSASSAEGRPCVHIRTDGYDIWAVGSEERAMSFSPPAGSGSTVSGSRCGAHLHNA